VSACLIPTNEELMIARHTGTLLGLIEARVAGVRIEEHDMAAMVAQLKTTDTTVSPWNGFGQVSGRGNQRSRLHPAELRAV
jgi:hypothetical protein